MFWVDRLADEIIAAYPDKKEFIIRDEKTLSGQVHVGSLRGVVIHALIAEALNKRGVKARFIYEFNDADPMDGMPAYLDSEVYSQHMGKPLKDVPAPGEREYQGMKASNLAEYYGLEFLEVIHRLGFKPEITWASKLYAEGFYDKWIRKVLEHPDKIRAIYKRISGSEKPDDWMPLQVVCEKCGKIGSTKVIDFDGEQASYRCEPDMVEWAKGCGHKGKQAPWNGRGKIPWKVEWAVKWASYGVDVEGSGKDHNAAGGSHDVSEAICKEVLETSVPFNVPYEFFLMGGAKMSSSKGNAASAKEVTDLLPPELMRFLMSMKETNQPIEFSPDGETIPTLFDRHDEIGRHYFAPESEKTYPDLDRLFYFSQLDEDKIVERFFPRFSKLIFFAQMPHIDPVAEFEKDKGSALTAEDKKELEERIFYLKKWLESYAPEKYIYKILDEVPVSATELSPEQKAFLTEVASILENSNLEGEAIHGEVHALVKASPLGPRQAFPAIYQSLLGKDFGPKVGWFIEALDHDFIVKRFKEVAASTAPEKEIIEPFESDLLQIPSEVLELIPDLKSAFIEFKGIKIGKNHPKLTELIDELAANTDWEELKASSTRLEEFKEMYRSFGVSPSKRKPSPVMLVDRLAKGKPFPRVNDLVDLYNYVTVKYQCSIGAFNMAAIQAPVQLRFAKKGERFFGLMDKERGLDEGELCYFDSAGLCIARDLNHLDADVTKITEEVTDVYLNVDGNAAINNEEYNAILDELTTLAQEICGGELGKRGVRLA